MAYTAVMLWSATQSNQRFSLSRAQGLRIMIEPFEHVKYNLDDLLAEITPQNAHAEASFGVPVGKESL